jgi:hypothetical protein
MNSTSESIVQNVELSVLIKWLAVVTFSDKCGVVTTKLISQHFCVLYAPQFTIRQYSVLRKETYERAKIAHSIEHVFIYKLST